MNVGVINLTTEATPGIVNPSGIGGLSFASTVKTAKMAVARLEKLGIRTVVIVGHLGTDQCLPEPKPGCDGNTLVTDPDNIAKNEAAKLARELDDEVDLIGAGHTHQRSSRARTRWVRLKWERLPARRPLHSVVTDERLRPYHPAP